MTTELELLGSYMEATPTPSPDDLEQSLSHLHAAMAEEAAARTHHPAHDGAPAHPHRAHRRRGGPGGAGGGVGHVRMAHEASAERELGGDRESFLATG